MTMETRWESLSEANTPFWLQPPWSFLLDSLKASKLSPWDIDIAYLVSSFLQKMYELGVIDFRVSGRALLSASIILRLKTQQLLALNTSPELTEEEKELVLPPLEMPLRLTSRKVTLDELLVALERVLLQGESRSNMKRPENQGLFIAPLVFELEPDMVNVEKSINETLQRILNLTLAKPIVKFSQLLHERTPKEVVKILLSCLHIANRGRIVLWQEEEFGEIFITLLDGENRK
ncbi:MAG: segregation/condensation protein A [Candidatus Atabeyarchaeum deiterrae]